MSDRTEIIVEAEDLHRAWESVKELRKYAIRGHGLSIARNEKTLKEEASSVSDALKDLNTKYMGEDGVIQLKPAEAVKYQADRDVILKEKVTINLFLIPLGALESVEDLPGLAYWLPMLEEPDDKPTPKSK